ncbi:MAG: hypothetical protein ABIR32_06975 [Ilumatobacteraceae bacterium]
MGRVTTSAMNALRRFNRRAIAPRLTDAAWRMQAASIAAVLGLMLFAVRVLGAQWPGKFKIFFPDSFSFLNAARHTPFSPSFYVAERPIAFPTLLFVLGRSTAVTIIVQTLLYGIVYLFAAFTVWHVLRQTEARIVAAFLVITIGLEPRFALWNTHILSESLGMTLAACSIVTWWRFSAAPSRRTLNWAGLATIAWLTARDSNVPPWMAVGVPGLLLASWLWKSVDPSLRRGLRRWGIVTLIVCGGVTLSQSTNGRNRYATINNVGLRVLPHENLTKWFVDQGMPLDDALRARTGSSSFDNDWDMLTSPQLQQFRDWADNSGQRVMLLSYARFFPHWVAELSNELPSLLSSDQHAYDAFGVADRLPDAAPAQINGPTTPLGLLAWTVLCLVALALATLRKRRAQVVVLGLLFASTFVDLYMAYVGDSVEVLRHMVGPLSRMALVMVIIVGVGLDSLFELVRPNRLDPVVTSIAADDHLLSEPIT